MNSNSKFDVHRRLALSVTALSLFQKTSNVNAQDRIRSQGVSDSGQPTLVGKWGRSTAYYPPIGAQDKRAAGGYTKNVYSFQLSNTYTFVQRSWSQDGQYIFVTREVGTFASSSAKLALNPKTSRITAYTKRNGSDWLGDIARSEDLALEAVAYDYSFYYFKGIQEWNLVLQALRETRRDGRFSANSAFRNAWLLDRKHVSIDLSAPRIS